MKRITLVILFFQICSYSYAGGMGPGRGGPPAEAINACNGMAEGGSCQFTAPQGQSISGQCLSVPSGETACVPADRIRGMTNQGAMRGNADRMPSQSQNRPLIQREQIAGENPAAQTVKSLIPDTHQGDCFDNNGKIACPTKGAAFYGQDAQYSGAKPQYLDNGDGTVTDLVTGLLWEQGHHVQRLGFYQAKSQCESLDLAGRNDWRLPTIKELYSLMDFRGAAGLKPYLNEVFEIQAPASLDSNDRFASTHSPDMMGQTWSSTIYAGQHYGRAGVEAAFFVNFLDGRIKQAPTQGPNGMFYRCVAGNQWGNNQFESKQAVVVDKASALMWQQSDDGQTRNWAEALNYCETLELAGYDDWRLPNAKELQSILDYTQHAPALNRKYFSISDPKAWYWSSTSLGDNVRQAVYVCFGPCTSVDNVDVHGAGAQRSDPKAGNPSDFGPMGGQRDAVRINNLVRCVR